MVEDPAIPFLRRLSQRSHAILTGRAAGAIWAILRALDLRDQWVLIPANTCYIVLWAVLKSGNKPYLIDIDPQTGNISHKTLSQCPIENPAVLIPCHMYGLPVPMAEICAWARQRRVFVIEDASLALGANIDGKPAGAWGDASVFSFGHGKIIDTEIGGAFLTDDAQLAAEVERILAGVDVWSERHADLTNQWNAIYWALHQFEAENPRLNAIYPMLFEIFGALVAYSFQRSAVSDQQNAKSATQGRREAGSQGKNRLIAELEDLSANLEHRMKMVEFYDELRETCPVWTLERPAGSILWRYPLLVSERHRDDLLQHLWENGVHDATRWYPPLRHMLRALRPDLPPQETSGADRLGAEIINLTVDGRIVEEQARQRARIVREYFEGI
jgi:dTDP-4-amino-4,6-dideoxygalactose transaminase